MNVDDKSQCQIGWLIRKKEEGVGGGGGGERERESEPNSKQRFTIYFLPEAGAGKRCSECESERQAIPISGAVNPFTAPVCEISGLKNALTRQKGSTGSKRGSGPCWRLCINSCHHSRVSGVGQTQLQTLVYDVLPPRQVPEIEAGSVNQTRRIC